MRKYPPAIFNNLKLIFMRKHLFFFGMLLCIFSCNQKTEKNKELGTSSQDTVARVTLPINNNAPIVLTEPGQKFTVTSGKINQVVGKKGLKITVDPSALETVNGATLGSNIEIELKEITNQEELFKNDAPTVSDGRLLVSGGAYYIAMVSGGSQLKIKKGRSLNIQIPKNSKNEMELFYGERDSNGTLNWKVAGKKIIPEKMIVQVDRPDIANEAISADVSSEIEDTTQISNLERLFNRGGGRISTTDFKNLTTPPVNDDKPDLSVRVKEKKDSITGKKVKEVETAYYNPVEIVSLGWINCDRFYNNPAKSEIQCEFDSSLDITSAAIYVIFKNINSLQREYIEKVNRGGLSRLINQYPAGEPVKLIAVTNVGGKFYESKKDLVLKSQELVKFKFSPVDDLAIIKNTFRYPGTWK